MSKAYTILIQKEKEGAAVKDTVRDWNIACTDIPFLPENEAKELPSRDWPDEDGEDTYHPETIKMKAYDLDISLCYKGDLGSAYTQIEEFMAYLTGRDGGGTFFKIYSPHTLIGRGGCYMKQFAPDDFWKGNGEDVLEFKITVRVTEPCGKIILSA